MRYLRSDQQYGKNSWKNGFVFWCVKMQGRLFFRPNKMWQTVFNRENEERIVIHAPKTGRLVFLGQETGLVFLTNWVEQKQIFL